MKTHLATALCLLLSLSACTAPTSGNDAAVATGAGAQKFMDNVNETLLKLGIEGSQAGWVSETHITDDTSALNARANQRLIDATARFSKESVKFDKLDLAPDLRRELGGSRGPRAWTRRRAGGAGRPRGGAAAGGPGRARVPGGGPRRAPAG